ncbi:uncharacterized protein LOC129589409 [Paramacrobiotus metropolitanus]|uniref:uncharacterized protein LOC129589409 n=1 Tax=Paramacrobiotus metropolitanus TaxID=2943436 RepID=UPI0024460136|nr:uncharacterized protein LOC129589409 [Paramacrobiotus metropolitanus]
MSFQSLLIGWINMFFGFCLVGLQVACYIMLHYWYTWGLFEGRFAPGAWLGGWIFITGIIGVVHGCTMSKKLRAVVIGFNVLASVLAVVMLALAVGWRLLDPEGFLYTDCEYPFVPWIYYYAPHCEAAHKVQIMGATMMAVAVWEVIFGVVAAVVVRGAETDEAPHERKKFRRP